MKRNTVTIAVTILTLLALAIIAIPPHSAERAPGKEETMTPEKYTGTEPLQVATLAGGCFWGMEDLLRAQPGVIATEVGYTGGNVANATYRNHEGHAEAVRIEFDPTKTSFEALLRFFFRMHDPTTRNRQGNDVGASYRSAIFYHNAEQQRIAEQVKAEVDGSGKWPRPLVTEIVAAGPWWRAEEEHQDYLVKHPGGYTCHWVRE